MCLFVCLTLKEMLRGVVAAVAKLRRHIRGQIVTLIVFIAVCVVIVGDSISFVTHGCSGRGGNLVSMDDNFRYATRSVQLPWFIRQHKL